jgi:phage host-nuclease inhibitor protein Gam
MSNPRQLATKRAKAAKLATILHSMDALESAVSTYATLELTLESLKLEAEAEMTAIRERWQTKIDKVADEMSDLLPQIEDYTRKHKSELFKHGVKTAHVRGHELCLHLTPPKVDTKRGVTQKAVLAALLEDADSDWADTFIRWSEALNKEAILGQWDTETEAWKPGGERLGELGVEITQDEAFALKTKRVLTDSKTSKGSSDAA